MITLTRTRSEPAPAIARDGVGGATASDAAPGPSRRWIYLDVLRAAAVLLVLAAHVPFRMPAETVGLRFWATWGMMGWVGVDLFFVLSGFLIGGLLFAEHRRFGKIAYGRFLARRALKIWPAYLVFIAAVATWDVRDGDGSLGQRISDTAGKTWPYLLHVQNYYGPLVERIGHAWSLAVEEHFYLFLPLVLAVMAFARRRKRPVNPFVGLRWVFAAVMIGCLAMRLHAWRVHPEFDEFAHHWPTHLRMDSLFAGVMLAYAVNYARPAVEAVRRYKSLILLASVTAFVPFGFNFYHYDSKFASTFGYTLLAAGSVGMVLWAWFTSQSEAAERRQPNAVTRGLAKIGTYSYSIYLWHMPFTIPLIERVRGPLATRLHLWESPWYYPVMLLAYFSIAITLGAMGYYLIEKPVLAMREKWVPSVGALARRREAEVRVEEPVVENTPMIQPAVELRAAG